MFVADGGSLHIGDINTHAKVWAEITGFMSEMTFEHQSTLLRENIMKSETIVKMDALKQYLKRDVTADDLLRTEKEFSPMHREGLTEYNLWYVPPPGDEFFNPAVKLGTMQIYYQEPNLMRVFWQHRYIKIKFKYQEHETNKIP